MPQNAIDVLSRQYMMSLIDWIGDDLDTRSDRYKALMRLKKAIIDNTDMTVMKIRRTQGRDRRTERKDSKRC